MGFEISLCGIQIEAQMLQSIVLLTNSKQVKKCFWFSYVVNCDFYVSSVNSDMVFDVDWRMLILIYALIFLF
jgi:asparagine synthetase A